MDPARWQRIQELFDATADLPVEQRATFLDGACAEPALRAEVDELLGGLPDAAGVVARLVTAEAEELIAEESDPVDRRLGPYRLVRAIGSGGMGSVHLAVRDDDEFKQEVAIKILRFGLESEAAVTRFRDERQILAGLQHPNIVRLLDGGSTPDGNPYLVMEHLDGEPITQYCEGRALPIRERVALFTQVCAAVELAHQRLVVHRDIKPANILVTRDGTAKLLDFGVARLLDQTHTREARTRTGTFLFTPEYASPEQARGEPPSTANDVYALGVVLFELLAGRPAQSFDGLSGPELTRVICAVEPPPPSTVAPMARRAALAGDLDNIVARALHKDRAQRYPSVAALGQDLGRHLDGRPVSARPATLGYLAGRFLRRNRVAVVIAALFVGGLGAASIVSIGQARRADAQAQRADRRFHDVQTLARSFLFDFDEKIRALAGATAARELLVTTALQYLDSLSREADGDRALTRDLAEAYLRIGEIQGSPMIPNLGHPDDALASFRRALALVDQLAADRARDTALLRLRAQVRLDTGIVESYEGHREAAQAAFAEAVRTGDELRAAGAPPYLLLTHAHTEASWLHFVAGDTPAAAAAARRALDEAGRWAAAGPTAEARYWQAVAGEMLGRSLAQLGDVNEAVHELEGAAQILETLVAGAPANAAYVRELGLASSLIAGRSWAREPDLLTLDDRPSAIKWHRRAAALWQSLAEKDHDDVRGRRDLASSQIDLATALAVEQPEEALRLMRATLDLLPDADDPDEARRRSQLRRELAVILERLGRDDEAEAQLAAARAALAPQSASRQTIDEIDIGRTRARLQARRGKTAEARRTLGQLVVTGEAVLSVAPRDTRLIGQLAGLHRDFGDLETGLAACASYRRSLQLWQAWPWPQTSATLRKQAQAKEILDRCR